MNTTLLNPKTQLLLGAGLDVLHFESIEWMDTIAFWKHEVTFFDNLLRRKEASEKNNLEYEKMLKGLHKIYNDLFEDLEDSIVKHEKLLSRILKGEKEYPITITEKNIVLFFYEWTLLRVILKPSKELFLIIRKVCNKYFLKNENTMELTIYTRGYDNANTLNNFMDFYYSLQMTHLASGLLNKGLSPKQISDAVAMAVKIAKSSGIGIQKHFMPVYSAINQEIIQDCKLSHLGFGLVLMNANPNLSVVGDFQVNILKEFLG